MRAMPSQLGVGLWRLPCTVRIELRHIARSRGGIGTEILLRDGAVLVDKDAAQISMMTLGRREKCLQKRSGKRPLPGVGCPPGAKRAFPGAGW